jgi:hypothetical protein
MLTAKALIGNKLSLDECLQELYLGRSQHMPVVQIRESSSSSKKPIGISEGLPSQKYLMAVSSLETNIPSCRSEVPDTADWRMTGSI